MEGGNGHLRIGAYVCYCGTTIAAIPRLFINILAS